MNNRWWRWGPFAAMLTFGVGVAAAVVGYLRLSLEPAVARQLPYLASAGMTVVLCSGLGVALLVTSRLAARSAEVQELREAVEYLADVLRDRIERPPRRDGPQRSS